ncbi:MAG: transcriptional regulator, LysR family [Firmicutes bacterium]|nr:transcriptional regulator, LysR family [Bacillota bacterium]
MEWHQLEYFKTLATVQHFTRAAEILSISQPALSRSIAKLEEEIGFPLFNRSGKQISLNRYGFVFLQYVRESLQKVEDGKKIIQDMVNPNHGIISLAFLLSLGTNIVPQLLSTYKTNHPSVQFRLFQSSTSTLLDQLEKGTVDLCLCARAINRETIAWQPLFNQEIFAVVPTTHHLAHRTSIELSELADDPLVTLKKDYGLRVLTDSFFESIGAHPAIAFEGEEILTLAGLVEANMGVALIPHNIALNQAHVSFIPISRPKCYRTIAMAWVKNRYMSPPVEQFKDFIITFLSKNN